MLKEEIEKKVKNEVVEITTEQEPIIERTTIIQIENEIKNIENGIKSFESRIGEEKIKKENLLKKLKKVEEKATKQVKSKIKL